MVNRHFEVWVEWQVWVAMLNLTWWPIPDRYNQLNFMLNKLIKFTCTDDIGVVLDGNCFDEVVAVEDV